MRNRYDGKWWCRPNCLGVVSCLVVVVLSEEVGVDVEIEGDVDVLAGVNKLVI